MAKNPAPAPAAAAAVEKRLVFVGGQEMGFDLEDLLRASAEVLGKGPIGTTYKAVLEKGEVVAVKRLRDVGVDEKEFRESMEAIGELDHENVVKLRAYYYSRDEKLLVYEFMPLGSLSSFLQGIHSSLLFSSLHCLFTIWFILLPNCSAFLIYKLFSFHAYLVQNCCIVFKNFFFFF